MYFRSDPELQRLDSKINALSDSYQKGTSTPEEANELAQLQKQAAPIERALNNTREIEIEAIRAIILPFEEGATIHMGGVHVLAYQLIQIITNDLVVFGTAIGIGICLMLALLFRALRWVLIPVMCCASSVLSTMGLFTLLDIKATVISSNFIALQLILTLAIVIHLIVQYRQSAVEDSSASEKALIKTTMLKKTGPCFFAGITTAVGFGSLIFSGIQPVIAFGWMMIIAMGVSITMSLVLFPVLLVVLPLHQQHKDLKITGKFTAGLAWFSLERRKSVLLVSLAVMGVSIFGILRLNVENSFINYFKKSTQVHQELAYIDREFGGTTPLDLVYTPGSKSDNPDIVITAATVQKLQLIEHALGEHEAVGRILSLVNLTAMARQLNGAPLTEYELTTAYWLMDAEFREDLLGSFYDPEAGQARMSIWIKDLTEGLSREQLLMDIRQNMEDLGVPESRYTLTNMLVLYQDVLQRLFKSQILTLGFVYAVLLLLFLLIFRSLRLAVIAIVPNILPTVTVLGTIGWLGIPLDLMTITIAAIAMGISVDDTIHYTHRFVEERKNHNYVDAVRRTHGSVGIAIFYTSLLIIAGFSMLAFSDFVPSIYFGLLTSLAMVLALWGDLCLLPALLRWLPGKSNAELTATG